ncbi:hypothetical protein LTR08_003996 [Meristemomyces frigidus]|nr:hypothetical protein LTR08_003996 [Meristemomyces frigidus]
MSGPSPKHVISQYQAGIVNTPVLLAYWNLGLPTGIQLEGITNDLDYLKMNRDFTDKPGHYDLATGKAFLDKLHAAG